VRTLILTATWLAVTGTLAVVLATSLTGERRQIFLPGSTTDGHHQIEERCVLCHTPLLGVTQAACLGCHGDELHMLDDSHPPAKFLDPRSYEMVASLDARACVTCHREHRPTRTEPGGVTQPRDFCRRCHADVGDERPSHQGLPFDGCQDAGCHNFHDNRALNQDFLERHHGEPPILPNAQVAPRQQRDHDAAGVGCDDCHRVDGAWADRPGDAPCAGCHERQVAGFHRGRHGMRPASGLAPMRPAWARLPMRADAADRELGCTACHGAHAFDRAYAAVEACLGCHADEHSVTYLGSPHHRLWVLEQHGHLPAGAGVSCATCHMPRDGSPPNHNQSATMRPPDKMVRPVCRHCHGVDFALDALADPVLMRHSFRGWPAPRPPLEEIAR
jgi:predicted CXXCH cytochrome family protein